MNITSVENTVTTSITKTKTFVPAKGQLSKIARKLVHNQLLRLHTGCFQIEEDGEVFSFGQGIAETQLVARLVVHDASCYGEIMTGGTIGAAESFMTGDWSSPNLTMLVRVMVRNMDILDQIEGGLALISKPLLKGFHYFNQNSAKGSRRNIAAHYDLGNDLFEAFLDSTMMYSSGVFPAADASMEEASLNKLKIICEKLQLTNNDHVVEIGTGWGGFAIYAAKNYGCKVTTTTISQQQFNLAKQRVEEAGLQDKITLLLEDYRDLKKDYAGQFDKLVSIEMIEAVGWKFYNTFFSHCGALLKPEGIALIQAITIVDQRYDQARKDVDFIQRYIFPGSCIPSITALVNASTDASDLNLVQAQDFGSHYARTLKIWQDTFNEKSQQISELGYSDDFKRMWQFYLSYCEGGFEERTIGVNHLVFAKPEAKVGY
jgi:cyclopropane-fatty-acyl-phospholipid synthase